jgi:hypothetical protein
MKRAIVLAATLIASPVVVPLCMAQGSAPAVGEEDAHAIGVAAYLSFYPLVTMDLTRKQLTNIEPGKLPGHGPMNTFANFPEFPPANVKVVVRPNFDTLYSLWKRALAELKQQAGMRSKGERASTRLYVRAWPHHSFASRTLLDRPHGTAQVTNARSVTTPVLAVAMIRAAHSFGCVVGPL